MRPRKVEIVAVLNGYVIFVGCQTVVFTDLSDMVSQLRLYLEDPSKMEEAYLKADRYRKPDEKLTGPATTENIQEIIRAHAPDPAGIRGFDVHTDTEQNIRQAESLRDLTEARRRPTP